MGTLCAMETIHLLDKEREVESEYRVPEKPIATKARSLLFLDLRYRLRKAAMNGIADCAPIQCYVARYVSSNTRHSDKGNHLFDIKI